jgi:hypothetical protein
MLKKLADLTFKLAGDFWKSELFAKDALTEYRALVWVEPS